MWCPSCVGIAVYLTITHPDVARRSVYRVTSEYVRPGKSLAPSPHTLTHTPTPPWLLRVEIDPLVTPWTSPTAAMRQHHSKSARPSILHSPNPNLSWLQRSRYCRVFSPGSLYPQTNIVILHLFAWRDISNRPSSNHGFFFTIPLAITVT